MNTVTSLDLRIGFVALALLCGCATAPRPRPVTDPTTPVGAAGFSVLPPSGGRWVQHADAAREIVGFEKADPEYAKLGRLVH